MPKYKLVPFSKRHIKIPKEKQIEILMAYRPDLTSSTFKNRQAGIDRVLDILGWEIVKEGDPDEN